MASRDGKEVRKEMTTVRYGMRSIICGDGILEHALATK